MRTLPRVAAGTYLHEASELVSGWHTHDLHEVEWAVSGVAELLTPSTHYVLPPNYAAWVPSGLPHSPILRDVRTVAVFWDPEVFPFDHDRAAIFPVPAVLREMILHATRWPIDRQSEDDGSASVFFEALAGVVRLQLANEGSSSLPVCADPIVAEVLEYTAEHLVGVTAAEVCRAVGISQRTLRRRFAAATGRTWREHLQHARLLRGMALLGSQDLSVRQVASSVGFESPSAFARAFQAWTGESPTSFRSRRPGRSPSPRS